MDRLRITTGAVIAVVVATVFLSSTGPRPEDTETGLFRRRGGACLELERWDLFGWKTIGQTYTVTDVRSATWHKPVEDPPCTEPPETEYLVRMPLDADPDVYRLCGLVDDEPCMEFRMIEWKPGEGGP